MAVINIQNLNNTDSNLFEELSDNEQSSITGGLIVFAIRAAVAIGLLLWSADAS
ncbi:hypothetical protein JYQ62_02585 [Nostoc sp. UHCC 0702]|nr:hypothetical protein JYQ62_02585 [Nostoc sp. UHCC 0702]